MWQATFDEAWAALTRRHPRRAGALAAGLRCLIPLVRVGRPKSSTDAAGFGSLALTPPENPLSLAEMLVHEFHHSVLFAVGDLAELHAADPDAVYFSPWRYDPRPIHGLLHGAYAFLGVTDYWEAQRGVLVGGERAVADFEFARWRRQILSVAQELLESGELTAAGTVLVRGMAATAERWCDLPVGDEPRRLADRTVVDHWIRWRMRNCRPAPAAIDAIARAWCDGQPCPPRPEDVPVTVLPQEKDHFPPGERTPLLRLRLADVVQFRELCAAPGSAASPAASEADLAYAADDFERAAREYRAAIEAAPDDVEAWAGLMLATAALPAPAAPQAIIAPEIARCVYLAILQSTTAAPDPDKLLQWMGCLADAALA
jgi:hypothetical protein